MKKFFNIFLIFFYLSLCSNICTAQDTSTEEIPKKLADWTKWVESRNPNWNCSSASTCFWPGVLKYSLESNGANFSLNVHLQKEGQIELPSSETLRPKNIRISSKNGSNVKSHISFNNQKILLFLPKGSFNIQGFIPWNSVPQELPIPKNYGIFTINSQVGDFKAERRGEKIWLGKKTNVNSIDSVALSVFRRITDDSPLKIETKIRLSISGEARPLDLGTVIPENTIPVSINSKLPHFLSAKGKLALQITPGTHEVNIVSLSEQPVKQLKAVENNLAIWPKEEIWSFKNNYQFRSVELKGAAPVHAEATKLPNEWKDGATYIVKQGLAVSFKELRRGLDKTSPNTLRLSREIWVDLVTDGLSVRDSFSGTMNSGFRLNALDETKLGRASSNGSPRLITQDPNSKKWGLELRNSGLNVQAISRYENTHTFSALGWDTQVNSLSGTLHLPPSWKLITILGASSVKNSWLDSWSLLQIFLSFLVILAAKKVFNIKVAALAAVCLIINHGEFLAPQMLFIHLLLLLIWHQVIEDKESAWLIACRVLILITFSALFIESLAFSKLQFTQMLFPQLQSGTRFRSMIQQLYVGIELTPLVWPVILIYLGLLIVWAYKLTQVNSIRQGIWKTIQYGFIAIIVSPLIALFLSIQVSSNYSKNQRTFSKKQSTLGSSNSFFEKAESGSFSKMRSNIDSEVRKKKFVNQSLQKALASGPSVPSWTWRSHYFQVDAPVNSEPQLKIISLPANIMRIVCGIRVLALLGLLFLLWKKISIIPKALASSLSGIKAKSLQASSIIVLIISSSLFNNSPAHAQFPSTELLTELEQRVNSKKCTSSCSTIQNSFIELSEDTFSIQMKVSSKGKSSIIAPGPLHAISPDAIYRDGKEYDAVRSNDAGFLEIATPDGESSFTLKGKLNNQSAFSLNFPQPPLFVNSHAPRWFIEGLDANGIVTGNIRFTKSKNKNSKTVESVKLPQWAIVNRYIEISETVISTVRVKRIGNLKDSVVIEVPLLENEKITSGGVKIVSNKAIISFNSGVTEKIFSSILSVDTRNWEISATETDRITESWELSCETNVFCKVSGLKPTSTINNGVVKWSWLPFPNEKIRIQVKKLPTISGDFITIDSLQHNIRWGTRLLSGSVEVASRVTQQTNLGFTTEEGSRIQEIKVNGIVAGAAQSKSKAQVLLNPGPNKIIISYERDFAPSLIEKAPAFTMTSPAHNVNISIRPHSSRWLLWTGGPAWGPSVVFWGKLLVIIFACCALVKIGILGMSYLTAVLLAIGLSSLPIILLWIPLMWLIILKGISEYPEITKKIPQKIRLITFVLISFLTIMLFYQIVRSGLVLQPPMLVAGNSSSYQNLKWYLDHTQSGELLQPWILSAPISWWRAFSLLWAMWLVLALFKWMKQAVDILRNTIYPK